jgi:hypothetical protein
VSENEFDSRLDQIERALQVIKTIDNSDIQSAAFNLLFSGIKPHPMIPEPTPVDTIAPDPTDSSDGSDSKPKKAKATGSKRSSKLPSLSQDKTLDLFPAGKLSFIDFAKEKAPANHNEKQAVCIYWLLEVAELPKATLNQIYSCYLTAGWNLSTSPRNALHVAGSAGILESADADDIKLISGGMNLVRNVLPRATKNGK